MQYLGELDDLHKYAQATAEELENVMNYAEECACKDAKRSAKGTLKELEKVEKAKRIDDAKYYAEEASLKIEELMSLAWGCG